MLHKRHGPRNGCIGELSLFGIECCGLQSAACGSARCRAYPPCWSCGRVAEGGGLLNRYRLVKGYRGFESLRLRQSNAIRIMDDRRSDMARRRSDLTSSACCCDRLQDHAPVTRQMTLPTSA